MQLQRVLMPHPVEILWEMLTLKLSQAGRNKYDKSDCCVAIYDLVDGGCRTRGVIHASVSHAHLDGIAVQFLSICRLSSLWRRPHHTVWRLHAYSFEQLRFSVLHDAELSATWVSCSHSLGVATQYRFTGDSCQLFGFSCRCFLKVARRRHL